jgi:hypothetical protein
MYLARTAGARRERQGQTRFTDERVGERGITTGSLATGKRADKGAKKGQDASLHGLFFDVEDRLHSRKGQLVKVYLPLYKIKIKPLLERLYTQSFTK